MKLSLKFPTLGIVALGLCSGAMAQLDLHTQWRIAAPSAQANLNPALDYVTKYQTFSVNYRELKNAYDQVPVQRFGPITTGYTISLPNPQGTLSRFRVAENPIMSPDLAIQVPSRTYRVQGIDDPYAVGVLDTGANGFHGFIRSPKGDYIIDPVNLGEKNLYVSYYRRDNQRPRGEFTCFVDTTQAFTPARETVRSFMPGGNFKTYRLAMNATIEYTAFYGSVANAQAGIVTSVNRVNQIYQIDMALTMTLVRNNPYTGSDPFSNNNGSAMLGENQTVCDATPGNANYDIGHVFSTGGGGVAGLAVVGVTGNKARGVTGSPSPIGDAFDIDYVAHEMGHQYGGRHTFNGTAGNCGGGNRSAGAAYEPGSGSTIMAYAGICGVEDLQSNSDAYFHARSFEEIWSWRDNVGSGGTSVNNGNVPPTASAGPDYTIPTNTPFKLTATGSDSQGDPITFCWEQFDLGTATSSPTQYSSGPLFRSFSPVVSPTRFFPNFPNVRDNVLNNFDKVPTANRTMTFRVTVRDNRGGGGAYATDDTVITASGAAFAVTSPNTNVSLAGGSAQTITWTVGGGSVAPNVRILLSTDGGNSYANGTATVLLASTANDGSETVTLPNVSTTQARIIVEAVGNVFYDISNVNFTITLTNNPVPTLTSISPNSATRGGSAFTLTANGTNFVSGSVVRWNGTNLTTTFVNSTQLTASVPAGNLAAAGTFPITVFNPTPGGGTSGSLNFTVNNPAPTLSAISPNTVTAGGTGFNLVVTGTNFVSDSVVRFNGTNRTTTFNSATQLTAAISAADVASVGTATITVFNATPGGGTSPGQTLTIAPIVVAPSSFSWVTGVSTTGVLSNLINSDDVYCTAAPDYTVNRNAPNMVLEASGAPGRTTASQVVVSVELGATTSCTMDIQVFNYSINDWQTVDTVLNPITDTVRTVTLSSGASNYLSGGPLRVRVRTFADPNGPRAWTSRVDRIGWTVNP